MYRDNKQLVTHSEHRFILNHGALGDMITSLPAIIHARLAVPASAMKMVVYSQAVQMPLIAHLLKPYGEFEVRDFAEVPLGAEARRLSNWSNGAATSMNAPPYDTHTRNRVHMVDFAFNYLIDSRCETMAQRSYPTLAPIGSRAIDGKYVVFPVGATSDNKLFRASVMTPVLEWCLGEGYRPVLVGTKHTNTKAKGPDGRLQTLVIREQTDLVPKAVFDACLDMRESTTLLDLRSILGHADAVVGVDGGTLHLAGTTDTNIVYAMGTTHPRHRYIARLGDHTHKIRYVVPRDLECAGCQSNWELTRLDFRFCAYGDNKCMEHLHPQDFIDGLKELLND